MLDIGDWLNVVLPLGKGNLIMYSLYSDESYIDQRGNFVVAGYLIGSKRLPGFVEAWGEALGPLEYFHMSEGHHKKYPEVYLRLLRLLSTDHLMAGFCASVKQDEYKRVMREPFHGHTLKYWFGGHYSFCVTAIADIANRWMNCNSPGERDMAYVFEAGHDRQGEADCALQKIAADPLLATWKKKVRYFSHSFADGKRREAAALQAADILAWHIVQSAAGNRPPEDVRQMILEVPTFSVHYTEARLRENIRDQIRFTQFYDQLKKAKKLKL